MTIIQIKHLETSGRDGTSDLVKRIGHSIAVQSVEVAEKLPNFGRVQPCFHTYKSAHTYTRAHKYTHGHTHINGPQAHTKHASVHDREKEHIVQITYPNHTSTYIHKHTYTHQRNTMYVSKHDRRRNA